MAQRLLNNRRYHVDLKGRTQYMGRAIRTKARVGTAWIAALVRPALPKMNNGCFMRILAGTLVVSIMLAAPATGIAQNVQPSAEQLRLLQQLPPAQRQQVLEAYQELQQQGMSTDTADTSSPQDLPPEPVIVEPDEPETKRVSGGDRLVVEMMPWNGLEPTDPILVGLQGSRLYILDAQGVLSLPGYEDIPLLGLNEEEIQKRLQAEPFLSDFNITASILAAEPIAAEALTPFGYDLFDTDEVSFEPAMAGPVPPDYILGPGDSIRVQLFGNVNGIYEFEITRDGVLNLPELGPITVAGLPFSEFRQDIKNRVQEMLVGTQVSVSMGELRNIRIFVLGEASRPGSYTVSSLATMSSALYRSGGIGRIGTLRNILLKRQGKLVTTLDLYDLLLNGDTSGDQRLQPGDVLFIPPIGETVSVGGAVKRPAIYELKSRASIADVVTLAGGLLPDAFPDKATLERIGSDRDRRVLSIDVNSAEGAKARVQAGDVLMIPYVLPELKETVTLVGQVQRPGSYQWQSGMWLTDLIPTALHLLPGADANYVLIRRESGSDRTVSAVSADLAAAFDAPHGAADVRLESRDTVHVFSLAYGRQRNISPILEELELQARSGAAYREVTVGGHVRAPGAYPLEDGMRISDLIRAGGNLAEQAYALEAELTRYGVGAGEARQTELVNINLSRILAGDLTADLALAPRDVLNIKEIPQWRDLELVSIEGEVRFPGTYPIRRGERLSSVIERAGGLSDIAFAEGAVFLRSELRRREQQQLEELAERLESEVAISTAVEASEPESEAARQALLDQLNETAATGRLVIDLPRILSDRSNDEVNVVLEDGDRLLIPQQSQTVTIIGEVQFPTSHIFELNISRNDYIGKSGGTTQNADEKRIYVVRADGEVVASTGSRFFRRRDASDIRPGDTIVVPLDADRISQLTLWTNVSTIIYNIGVAAAAVASF